MGLFGKKTGGNRKSEFKAPKSVQDSIPYYAVYPDDYAFGVIEVKKGIFSVCFLLQDVSFATAKDYEQGSLFKKYGELLNSFDSGVEFQITINNKNIDKKEFTEQVLLKHKNDRFDDLRDDYNDILINKLKEGRNNTKKEKYLTVSIEDSSIDKAMVQFARIESDVLNYLKRLGSNDTRRLSNIERLEILHDIYNIGNEGRFLSKLNLQNDEDTKTAKYFDFQHIIRQGLTTKDIIAPASLEFKPDYMMIGDIYARGLYIKNLPSFMQSDFFTSVTDVGLNMIATLNMRNMSADEAIKILKRQVININSDIIKKQKNAAKAGFSIDLISPELKTKQEETLAFIDDISNKNQKMFIMNGLFVIFADSKEQLDSDTKMIQSIGNGKLCDIQPVKYMQELVLDSALPLAYNRLKIERTLATESMAIFMPFSSQELLQKDGMYYGLNSVSKNIILYNRLNSKNGNGFILGTPGSGKSMSAKNEMLNVLLTTDADVIVIDPEAEYYPMAELLGGEVVRIAIGSDVYINPMDIDMKINDDPLKTDDDPLKIDYDPLAIKTDFIISLCETAFADRYGISAAQKSIIDKCVVWVYKDYLNSYDAKSDTYDETKLPTLLDLQKKLEEQPGYEAKQLADSLEMYTRGTLNIFAHHTNVSYDNRFVVYDIKNIGTNLKGMGLLVVLDSVWNRIIQNRRNGKQTYFYIDEIYLLFKNNASATFLKELYKRARKYGGVPTGITQNVTDMLDSEIAKTMIHNCEFVQMLNQSAPDRAELAQLLGISDTQLDKITDSSPGEGLIYTGSSIIPFTNKLPTDSRIYKAMTTKLSEVKVAK